MNQERELIGEFTARCYGPNGDEKGSVFLFIDMRILDKPNTDTVEYRWIEDDDSGVSDSGEWTRSLVACIRACYEKYKNEENFAFHFID